MVTVRLIVLLVSSSDLISYMQSGTGLLEDDEETRFHYKVEQCCLPTEFQKKLMVLFFC